MSVLPSSWIATQHKAKSRVLPIVDRYLLRQTVGVLSLVPQDTMIVPFDVVMFCIELYRTHFGVRGGCVFFNGSGGSPTEDGSIPRYSFEGASWVFNGRWGRTDDLLHFVKGTLHSGGNSYKKFPFQIMFGKESFDSIQLMRLTVLLSLGHNNTSPNTA
eukprot:PhF_6_TR2320/c0_g2_i8/m.4119